jgi:type II secretory pathway component GspD/PulD (secretin)
MDRNSLHRAVITRRKVFCFCILFVLGWLSCIQAEERGASTPVLQSIAWQKFDDRGEAVFTFKGIPAIEEPVITKNRVNIYCKDTVSSLAPYQSGKKIKSWAQLKQANGQLSVELAIPAHLPKVRHAVVKESGQLIVSFHAADRKEEAPKTAPPSGHLLSLNFHESDIKQALLGLAMNQNVNIVVSPEVTGKVTVHLSNLPLEEAISSITMAGGYHYRFEKGTYFIYKPKEKYEAQSDRLEVKIFKLKFAKTDKVQEILTAMPGIRTVRIHEDTKSVIVEDTPENIAKIEEVIDAWDASPRQVLIEAKILEVTLSDDMRLGVDWTKIMGSVGFSTFPVVSGAASSAVGNFAGQATGGGIATVTSAVGTAHEFSLALAALQSKTNVNTLSTPKILAVHGKPARVQVGGKFGYSTTVTNLGVTTQQVQFIDTGTLLDITAFISDESNILLNVQPQLTDARPNPDTKLPDVTTTTVSTSLLTKSGQTVFIGGLIRETVQHSQQQVPFLGRIPLIGLFFGYSNPRIVKSELVILITPYLQPEDIGRASTEAARKIEKVNEQRRINPPNVYNELFEKRN